MVCGIDPGKQGGFAVLDENSKILRLEVMPDSVGGLCFLVNDLVMNFPSIIFVIEDIHSIFGVSKGSMFTMGRGVGNLEASVICNGGGLCHVTPKKWQSAIWKPEDIVLKDPSAKRKIKDTKATSMNAVKRLYPNVDFRYGDNEKKTGKRVRDHDGLIDAVLIAFYGVETYLK